MVDEKNNTNQDALEPIIDINAYAPARMAQRVGEVGIAKTKLETKTLFASSILAGVFIAMGMQLSVLVTHATNTNLGLSQLVGGVAFTLALILIVISGAELFTGNCLVAISFMAKKITGKALARNLIISFIGNFIGASSLVVLIYASGQWEFNHHLLGAKILLAANQKVNMPFHVAFARGVLCNGLVCLAFWLCYSGRSNIDKILSLLWPITAIIACGYEHSVVNMWLIPMGIAVKANREVITVAENVTSGILDLSNLTFFKGFLIDNLFPVSIGNLLGGFMIASAYWFIYLRHSNA